MGKEVQTSGAAQLLEGGELIDALVIPTKVNPGEAAYETVKSCVRAFIAELVSPKREGETIERAVIDALIAKLDSMLSHKIDADAFRNTLETMVSDSARRSQLIDEAAKHASAL